MLHPPFLLLQDVLHLQDNTDNNQMRASHCNTLHKFHTDQNYQTYLFSFNFKKQDTLEMIVLQTIAIRLATYAIPHEMGFEPMYSYSRMIAVCVFPFDNIIISKFF